VIPNKVTVTVV